MKNTNTALLHKMHPHPHPQPSHPPTGSTNSKWTQMEIIQMLHSFVHTLHESGYLLSNFWVFWPTCTGTLCITAQNNPDTWIMMAEFGFQSHCKMNATLRVDHISFHITAPYKSYRCCICVILGNHAVRRNTYSSWKNYYLWGIILSLIKGASGRHKRLKNLLPW